MSDAEDDNAELVHSLFEPFRKRVTRVSADFGRRVAKGIESFLEGRDSEAPSLIDVFGGFFVDTLNAATDREDDDE